MKRKKGGPIIQKNIAIEKIYFANMWEIVNFENFMYITITAEA